MKLKLKLQEKPTPSATLDMLDRQPVMHIDEPGVWDGAFPKSDEERKRIRLSAIWKLFPDATIALAEHIQTGADKYCGGKLEWDRSKSPEEIESLLRHAFEQVHDEDDVEIAKAIAWRGMANLQKVIERCN